MQKTKGHYSYNECEDFLKLDTTCHMLVAAMEYLQVDSLNDTPPSSVILIPKCRCYMGSD